MLSMVKLKLKGTCYIKSPIEDSRVLGEIVTIPPKVTSEILATTAIRLCNSRASVKQHCELNKKFNSFRTGPTNGGRTKIE